MWFYSFHSHTERIIGHNQPTPIKQDYLSDRDSVLDRKNDLFYHDKTFFDERVAGSRTNLRLR